MIAHITLDQLREINTSLSKKIEELASKLSYCTRNVEVSYWIDVEMIDNQMFLFADNGYDISEEINVPENYREAIYKLVKV